MDTCEVKVKAKIYTSSDFAILATEPIGKLREGVGKELIIKGELTHPVTSLIDQKLTLYGKWTTYKGAPQFSFDSYQLLENQMVFFLYRMVGGISEPVAKKVVETFGESLESVLDKTPEKLLSVKGIKEKTLKKILKRWEEFRPVKRLGEFLLPFGVSNNLILRIHKHFGEGAIGILSNNPYRMVEIHGIGFKTADGVALKMGMPHDSAHRLEAGVMFCLDEKMRGNGDTVISLKNLFDLSKDELSGESSKEVVNTDLLQETITSLVKTTQISVVTGTFPQAECRLTLPWLLSMEKTILALCDKNRQREQGFKKDVDRWIERYEKKSGRVLGEQQREAVHLANRMPLIMAISGYAGTGKTTTAQAVLELYQDICVASSGNKPEITCCALSGIAANRVKNQSGFPGGTIHSLLGFNGSQFEYNKDNKLPYQVVLLDEASMVDTEIMYRLMQAIDFEHGARMVMLGDPAQLPPVGAGAPFTNLLQTGQVPCVELDKIYRQSEDMVITAFASEIRKGVVPVGYQGKHADFHFIDGSVPGSGNWSLSPAVRSDLLQQSNEKIIKQVADMASGYRERLDALFNKKDYAAYITAFQVLSPMNKGAIGNIRLNQELQQVLNPGTGDEEQEILIGDRAFRPKDKVVHLKNNNQEVVFKGGKTETKRVFNGQMGVVLGVSEDGDGDDFLDVYYPVEGYATRYSRNDLATGMVNHAYSLSVHKAQGSEFEDVVVLSTNSHYIMNNTKLLYTAITRAKSNLFIVGQPKCFEQTCRTFDKTVRQTCICALQDSSAGVASEVLLSPQPRQSVFTL